MRATLARIFAATTLVPAKMFAFDEELGDVKLDDEFVMPDTDTLKALAEWGNFNQAILKTGRTTHIAPESNDPEFNAEDALAAL